MTISLKPPELPSLALLISYFHPFFSMNLVYMRNRSPAKMAASSPPVPPRISTIAFLLSCGSAGINNSLICSSICAKAGSSSATSMRAISRNSSSFSCAKISLASSRLFNAVRYLSLVSTIGCSSLYSLFSATNFLTSAITSGSVICCPISSYLIFRPSRRVRIELSAIRYTTVFEWTKIDIFLFFRILRLRCRAL